MASDSPPVAEPTPAERRRLKVRDQIVAAAEAVFSAEGHEGLSMRRIADRVDYSPAALYKYFPSKGALVACIREMFFERLLRRLDAVMAEFNDEWSLACARRSLRAYVECGLEQPNHYRMAFLDDGETTLDETTLTWQAAQRLRDMVATGVEHGDFTLTDPVIAADCVWLSLHGLTMMLVEKPTYPNAMSGAEHLTRDRVIEYQIALILAGLTSLREPNADGPRTPV